MDVSNAVRLIQEAAERGRGTHLQVAASYAKSMLDMSGNNLKTQSLYVLSNLQYWKGDTAKEVKTFLRTLV